MQKTSAQANDCPQRARTESEWYEGVQTYIWMTEDNIVEVPFDKEHLLEVILSPANLNAAYKCVVRNKGCGGVDKCMVAEIRLNGTDKVRAFALDLDEYCEFGLKEEDAPSQSWARYIFGVCRETEKRGGKVGGFDTVFSW